jgi:hypothetical protein
MSETVAFRNCEWCGEEFAVSEYNPDQQYCSISCSSRQQHTDMGHDVYPNSKTAKEQARERDNYECQCCGRDVGYKNDDAATAEIHHLIPQSAGGPDHKANLVTLCRECHDDAHNAFKDLPETHPELLDELRDVVCEDGGNDV